MEPLTPFPTRSEAAKGIALRALIAAGISALGYFLPSPTRAEIADNGFAAQLLSLTFLLMGAWITSSTGAVVFRYRLKEMSLAEIAWRDRWWIATPIVLLITMNAMLFAVSEQNVENLIVAAPIMMTILGSALGLKLIQRGLYSIHLEGVEALKGRAKKEALEEMVQKNKPSSLRNQWARSAIPWKYNDGSKVSFPILRSVLITILPIGLWSAFLGSLSDTEAPEWIYAVPAISISVVASGLMHRVNAERHERARSE